MKAKIKYRGKQKGDVMGHFQIQKNRNVNKNKKKNYN